MTDAAAVKEDDSDFELDVESDDDLPLVKKKQKSNRQAHCCQTWPVTPTGLLLGTACGSCIKTGCYRMLHAAVFAMHVQSTELYLWLFGAAMFAVDLSFDLYVCTGCEKSSNRSKHDRWV